ncbi:ABC transporter ATP-binding protein [Chelativorans xinjiangense]|uniref:ABC transporter ATP-binding protein n=1 Tax=Chelativorans xinjiangense TaxID=2681485 RepID=UPI001357DECE|nr:ABC transporter ATP-binding protein [Chelativorans xinjiangense]
MRILLDKFSKSFGDVRVIEDMTLEINDGEMLALLGPSGCGKSTTLFAICGIHKVTGGRILFGDRDMTGVPSQERNVGVVFQSYALYPHMTVAENIAFPLRIRKLPEAEVKRQMEEMANLVHIEALLDRRPAELSGGQQQRVALARALVRRPNVLLLDEPLANLDAKLRLEMRSEIRRIQLETGITAILVTHDQVEAMSMCDRIAIMNAGEIIQIATPQEMYRNPRTAFVAGFLGNPPIAFIDAVASNGTLTVKDADIRLPVPPNTETPPDGTPVIVGIRPENLGRDGDAPIRGRISFVETQGRENLYDLTLANGSVLRSIQRESDDVSLNDEVEWRVRSDQLFLFAQNGERL